MNDNNEDKPQIELVKASLMQITRGYSKHIETSARLLAGGSSVRLPIQVDDDCVLYCEVKLVRTGDTENLKKGGEE